MKDEKGPNKKKEKIIMYVSAALVLSAMTITGMRLRNVGIRENNFQLDIPDSELDMDQNSLAGENWANWNSSGNLVGAELDYSPAEDLQAEVNREEESTIVSTGKVKVGGPGSGETKQNNAEQKKDIFQGVGNLESLGDFNDWGLDGETAMPEGELQAEGGLDETEGVILWGDTLPEGMLDSLLALQLAQNSGTIGEENIVPTGSNGSITQLLTAEQALCQPVAGTVLIPYSMEHVVYFPTLDQYKLSSAVVYGATVGDEVKACGRARVTQIYQDSHLGQVVEMELGRGLIAKYGQLSDVRVAVGQVLEKDQVIGAVAEPSRYYSLEGANVYFALTKDGQPVNPTVFLENREVVQSTDFTEKQE